MHELTDDKFAAVNGQVDRPTMLVCAGYQDNVMLTSMLPRVAFE